MRLSVLPPAQRDFLYGHKAHEEHRENATNAATPLPRNNNRLSTVSQDSAGEEKARIEAHAHAQA